MSNSAVVGTWVLESSVLRFADGTVESNTGGEAVGSIMYDSAGRMSVQIFKIGRTKFASPDPRRGTPGEMADAYEWSVSYFGRYSLEQQGQIVHHVEGSLFPNWQGIDQVRYLEIEGDRLFLTTPTITMAGRSFAGELTWRKVTSTP